MATVTTVFVPEAVKNDETVAADFATAADGRLLAMRPNIERGLCTYVAGLLIYHFDKIPKSNKGDLRNATIAALGHLKSHGMEPIAFLHKALFQAAEKARCLQ